MRNKPWMDKKTQFFKHNHCFTTYQTKKNTHHNCYNKHAYTCC